MIGTPNLAELSRAAHTLAIERAKGADRWNARYRAELNDIGFDLVPVSRSTCLGVDGPMWAPLPADDGEPYSYPCVVAPIGWTPEASVTVDDALAVEEMDRQLADARRMLIAAAISAGGELVITASALVSADGCEWTMSRDDANAAVRLRVKPKAI